MTEPLASALELGAEVFGRVRCGTCERRMVARSGTKISSQRITRQALERPCPHCGGELVLDTRYLRGR